MRLTPEMERCAEGRRVGVNWVIRSIRHIRDSRNAGQAELAQYLNFLRKNRSRMRYRALQDNNLPTGSGMVESAN